MSGLIITRPMKVTHNSLEVGGGLPPQQLRFWATFWDKLDFPQNNLIGMSDDSADVQFLTDAGVLESTLVRLEGTWSGLDFLPQTYLKVLEEKERQEPGAWAMGQNDGDQIFPNEPVSGTRGTYYRLVGALPVPDREVPLEDVLVFKEKRRAELVALRSRIAEMSLEVGRAEDKPFAEFAAISNLQAAVNDHIKVSREAGFKMRWSDLQVSLPTVVASVAAGGALGLDLIASAAAGGALAWGPSIGWKKAQTSSPFAYLSAFHKEFA